MPTIVILAALVLHCVLLALPALEQSKFRVVVVVVACLATGLAAVIAADLHWALFLLPALVQS